MKVICIDAKKRPDEYNDVHLVEGAEYNVIGEVQAYDKNYKMWPCYHLSEFPYPCAFDKDRFIPISNIDEKEFERNYKKELV